VREYARCEACRLLECVRWWAINHYVGVRNVCVACGVNWQDIALDIGPVFYLPKAALVCPWGGWPFIPCSVVKCNGVSTPTKPNQKREKMGEVGVFIRHHTQTREQQQQKEGARPCTQQRTGRRNGYPTVTITLSASDSRLSVKLTPLGSKNMI